MHIISRIICLLSVPTNTILLFPAMKTATAQPHSEPLEHSDDAQECYILPSAHDGFSESQFSDAEQEEPPTMRLTTMVTNNRMVNVEQRIDHLENIVAAHTNELINRITALEEDNLALRKELREAQSALCGRLPPGLEVHDRLLPPAEQEEQPSNVDSQAIVPFAGHRVEGCPCGRSWRFSITTSPSWEPALTWAIQEHARDPHYAFKLVQRMHSSQLCGDWMDKHRCKQLHATYLREMEERLYIGTVNDRRTTFVYLKAYKDAAVGCVHCKGFDSFQCNTALANNWSDSSAAETETQKFAAWLKQLGFTIEGV